MRISNTSALYIIFAAALVIATYFIGVQTKISVGSAPAGLPATIATTSNPSVTSTAGLVFATTTGGGCAARVITTGQSSINIGFSDVQGIVPTQTLGHFQATSTTVAYDSGQYGCGAVRIWSFATQNLTVSESR